MAVRQKMQSQRVEVTHRSVLRLAIPVMLSNVSTPLIGVVDTAVVGRLGAPAYIGAVALGALIFTFVFWAFGFLRMGTTGLTAQALGAGDRREVRANLERALLIAAAAGGLLIVIQAPLASGAFRLLQGTPQVEALARSYFDIRIWAAPVTLANYAILGWFIGRGRTDIALVLQLVLNVTNIAFDALFVVVFQWGVDGVAWGTCIAEAVACGVGLVWAQAAVARIGVAFHRDHLLSWPKLKRNIAVNRDIMIRSMALILVFVWFTSQGARQGDVILAANAVLMHFISMSAYFLDGLAFAAEALVGRAVGANSRKHLHRSIRITTLWAAVVAAALCVTFLLAGDLFIDALATDTRTRSAARDYLPWASFAPLLGVWAFQLDGIFIGATATVAMRNAMLVSLAIFFFAWWMLMPWGNHGLWASLFVHYVARVVTLGVCLPALPRLLTANS